MYTAITVFSTELEVMHAKEAALSGEIGADDEGDVEVAPLGAGVEKLGYEALAKGKIEGSLSFDGSIGLGSSNTAEFTTTWTYTTSDDPLLAGWQSDVMVVPNLNIQLHRVKTIVFDKGKGRDSHHGGVDQNNNQDEELYVFVIHNSTNLQA